MIEMTLSLEYPPQTKAMFFFSILVLFEMERFHDAGILGGWCKAFCPSDSLSWQFHCPKLQM